MIKVKFKQWNCIATFSRYASNKRVAIKLIEETTGEPIATASVNLPEIVWDGNEQVAIKDYSENEGMVEALTKAGIIGNRILLVDNGHVEIGIYELLKTK